jgi:glycosyltransferase involved in cell wall biosynthesis
MKHISIMTACYNEEENVRELHKRVKAVFDKLGTYTYEHLFIDNASKDRTVDILREIAREDPNVKVIVNARNFGHIRSPFHALLQTSGDAVISLVADFQEPPEMIPEFLAKWEEGYKVVIGVKNQAEESGVMFGLRRFYYWVVSRLSEVDLIPNFTGFGLYDRRIIEALREIDDPYPYFRGLIADIGFPSYKIPYKQPRRWKGITKNNFYTLYDMAMLGITNHSRVPLRLAAFTGFVIGAVSLLVAFGYFIAKLVYWDWFTVGIAPLIISLFFFASVQLFFIGIIGEYIGAILTQVQKRPRVIERERINFDVPPRNVNGVAEATRPTRIDHGT